MVLPSNSVWGEASQPFAIPSFPYLPYPRASLTDIAPRALAAAVAEEAERSDWWMMKEEGTCCVTMVGLDTSSPEQPWPMGGAFGAECQRGDGAEFRRSRDHAPRDTEGLASGNSPIPPKPATGGVSGLDEHGRLPRLQRHGLPGVGDRMSDHVVRIERPNPRAMTPRGTLLPSMDRRYTLPAVSGPRTWRFQDPIV